MTQSHSENDKTVPRRWRKRPVEVEAVQWLPGLPSDDPSSNMGIIGWLESHGAKTEVGPKAKTYIIHTLEGSMIASPGDWIIRGVAGEFYLCKPDIFEATYEPGRMAMTDQQRSLPVKGVGDAWRVTVERWAAEATTDGPDGNVTWGGNKLDDFIAYAVAHTAQDAAEIIEAETAGKYGPRTRVIRVEYAGPAFAEGDK